MTITPTYLPSDASATGVATLLVANANVTGVRPNEITSIEKTRSDFVVKTTSHNAAEVLADKVVALGHVAFVACSQGAEGTQCTVRLPFVSPSRNPWFAGDIVRMSDNAIHFPGRRVRIVRVKSDDCFYKLTDSDDQNVYSTHYKALRKVAN